MANQNVTQLAQQTVSANTSSLFYAVTSGTTDTGLPFSVLVNNIGLTGIPTVPTATTGTNTTQIASTAFVQAQNTATLANYAPLAGATFTGVVTLGFSNPSLVLNDTSATQKTAYYYKSNGTTIWDTSAQSPTGSWALDRWNSNVYADSPIVVSNVTGVVTMQDGIAGTPVGAAGASTGNFTTLAASGAVSGTGFTNLFASPPPIGGTTAAAIKGTTIQATSAITPSTTAGIVGTTLADNATAGSIGEFVTATGSSVAISNATATNITSISLTAGDWDVWGAINFVATTVTTITQIGCAVSTTTGTLAAQPNTAILNLPFTNTNQTMAAPMQRINVSSTTTVFLVGIIAFTGGTEAATGTINARRRR